MSTGSCAQAKVELLQRRIGIDLSRVHQGATVFLPSCVEGGMNLDGRLDEFPRS